METFEIIYHPKVLKNDIPKLDNRLGKRIAISIEQKLRVNPYIFGTPLRNKLKKYSKLRVGDYRVIFYVKGQEVFVDLIAHRSIVYKEIENRI